MGASFEEISCLLNDVRSLRAEAKNPKLSVRQVLGMVDTVYRVEAIMAALRIFKEKPLSGPEQGLADVRYIGYMDNFNRRYKGSTLTVRPADDLVLERQ